MSSLFPIKTDLVYNIVEETLTGNIDGVSISALAASGGRGGSKTPGAVNYFLVNNPYMTRVRRAGKRPGGPIPLARYRLSTHERHAHWIRLTPLKEDRPLLHGRAGFAIHPRGRWGSDGCIVPTDFAVVRLIHRLVEEREQSGSRGPILQVVAIGDLDRFDRLRVTA